VNFSDLRFGDWMALICTAQYLVIFISYVFVKSWGPALYWGGAMILNCGVVIMSVVPKMMK
jgi:hypothetical protein